MKPPPSEEEIDARLREAARLSAEADWNAPRVDMSPEAVDRRLREAAELSALCFELAAAGRRAEEPLVVADAEAPNSERPGSD